MLSFIAKRITQQFRPRPQTLNTSIYVSHEFCTQSGDGNNSSSSSSSKKSIDYSKVPVLNENDLEEKFVRGSGPGGQAVNKTSNAVVLRHIPTNIIVKSHMHRSAVANRKEARKILIAKLDERENGPNSVENQLKAIQNKKAKNTAHKRKKLNELKEKWKHRENIEDWRIRQMYCIFIFIDL